ncbi:MAG: DUF2911 domain-containing protein [Cytophagales bacterium]|nr:DUF2911 domain-containing protein [Cytophagales bacterium]
MKKKIFMGIGAVILLLVAYGTYTALFVPPKSPTTNVSYSDRGLDLSVSYSQPSKRGRLIFGEEAAGALQPYGKYWRLGANKATEITFSKDVNFGGQPVNAGSYRMYAVPNAQSFSVALNSELGVNIMAVRDADHDLDVATLDVPVQVAPMETEMFTIAFRSDSVGVLMDFMWDKTHLTIPITAR